MKEIRDGKGIITINRPKVLNAIDWDTFFLLQAALEEMIADQNVRVIVLTGSGEKSFISGGDVGEEFKMDALTSYRWSLTGHKLCATIESSPKPVIAAVNGYCLGGGFEFALACDFIICSENAKFGAPEFGPTPFLWGEAPWNHFGAFYYVSGFSGYMLLGFYFRKSQISRLAIYRQVCAHFSSLYLLMLIILCRKALLLINSFSMILFSIVLCVHSCSRLRILTRIRSIVLTLMSEPPARSSELNSATVSSLALTWDMP